MALHEPASSMSALESYVRPREGVVRYSGIDALNGASRELRRAA